MNEIHNIYILYHQIQYNINGYNCTQTTNQCIVVKMYLHHYCLVQIENIDMNKYEAVYFYYQRDET